VLSRFAAVAGALLAVAPGAADAATTTYSSGRLATPILSGRTVEHALDVGDAGPVARVVVWLRLDHPRPAELRISLVAPSGQAVVLANRRGGTGRNFGAGRRDCGARFTVFEDAIGTPVAEARAPFLGVHQPERRLAAFARAQARGRWKLRIEAAPGSGRGRLYCWKLDVSRDVVETKRAASGAVAAELSFRETSGRYKSVRLRITRAGERLVESPLRRLRCRVCRDITGFALLPLAGNPLVVRDVTGDGEPEVLLDLYTGGAHCCSFTLVFMLRGARYTTTEAYWGNTFYRLDDLDGDGRPEFVSTDDRFSYAFGPYAVSARPMQVWHLDEISFIDVTRDFPGVVARQARSLLRAYERATPERRRFEARGLLAAYMADMYLLGRDAEGWRMLERAYARGDLGRRRSTDGYPVGRTYLSKLRAFLRGLGYAR
jgi:subtilisin-like proprotein convertase family protein